MRIIRVELFARKTDRWYIVGPVTPAMQQVAAGRASRPWDQPLRDPYNVGPSVLLYTARHSGTMQGILRANPRAILLRQAPSLCGEGRCHIFTFLNQEKAKAT